MTDRSTTDIRLGHIERQLNEQRQVFTEVRDIMVTQAQLTERLVNAGDSMNRTNIRITALEEEVKANRDQILKWSGAIGIIATLIASVGTIAKLLGLV